VLLDVAVFFRYEMKTLLARAVPCCGSVWNSDGRPTRPPPQSEMILRDDIRGGAVVEAFSVAEGFTSCDADATLTSAPTGVPVPWANGAR